MITRSRKRSEAAPARIGRLARLPVFLELAGRKAVVAGGGAGAAWKAELLAAAGAEVTVLSSEPSSEMRSLAEARLAAGSVRLIERAWQVDDLPGAALVVAEADNEAEAATVNRAAKRAGIPVNVIDRPEFCDFQFGAIVNRSPVVIGISTDGAAPILGQAIRRRIETLIPETLSGWARTAKQWRGVVLRRLPDPAARRAFWERFVDLAFGGEIEPEPERRLDRLVDDIAGSRRDSCRVTLVGAGPGDAELLTIKAMRALQRADVILFDDLVSDEVLELARREAKRMLVGKRSGRHSCRQEDINALMVKLARQGKHVVRLKSGDPTIFGRAGEELAVLRQAGIPVEIVPGVTTASAAAARLGLSLTHRDHAHSVRFVTGHSRAGGLSSDLDWRGLADPETTLVVYMGGRTAELIAGRLMANGLPEATPVALVENATRRDERIRTTTLARLGKQSACADGPVLIIIGRAVAAAAAAGGQAEPTLSSDSFTAQGADGDLILPVPDSLVMR
jgi:uroporphyrin-III C-methyltransferase / precorrin-2 dehydrogenase / sirohydrochlorin ferrochelatase